MNERKRFWFGTVVGGVAAFLLIGGVWVATSNVNAAGWGLMGFHHGHGGARLSPEQVDFAAEYVLRRLNATDEQKARIKAVLGDSVRELSALGERHEANRASFLDALSGATVDRAALEIARKTEIDLADEASRRLVETVARVAEELTPAQRAELLDHLGRAEH